MKVFVYGTLKKGYGNNRLLTEAEYLGEAFVEGFRMYYSWGKGSYPIVVPDKKKIKGEVYEIKDDRNILNNLDALEGHPNMYKRTPVKTECGQDVELYVWQHKIYDDNVEVPFNNYYEWSR